MPLAAPCGRTCQSDCLRAFTERGCTYLPDSRTCCAWGNDIFTTSSGQRHRSWVPAEYLTPRARMLTQSRRGRSGCKHRRPKNGRTREREHRADLGWILSPPYGVPKLGLERALSVKLRPRMRSCDAVIPAVGGRGNMLYATAWGCEKHGERRDYRLACSYPKK